MIKRIKILPVIVIAAAAIISFRSVSAQEFYKGEIITFIVGPTTAKTFTGLYELNPSLIAKLEDILVPKR